MTDDIVERLRHQWTGEYDPTGQLLSEAADEIERLRALITDLFDADDDDHDGAYHAAWLALRKVAGR